MWSLEWFTFSVKAQLWGEVSFAHIPCSLRGLGSLYLYLHMLSVTSMGTVTRSGFPFGLLTNTGIIWSTGSFHGHSVKRGAELSTDQNMVVSWIRYHGRTLDIPGMPTFIVRVWLEYLAEAWDLLSPPQQKFQIISRETGHTEYEWTLFCTSIARAASQSWGCNVECLFSGYALSQRRMEFSTWRSNSSLAQSGELI